MEWGFKGPKAKTIRKTRVSAYDFYKHGVFRAFSGKTGLPPTLCHNLAQAEEIFLNIVKRDKRLRLLIYCNSSINYVYFGKIFFLGKRKTPTTLTTLTTLKIRE